MVLPPLFRSNCYPSNILNLHTRLDTAVNFIFVIKVAIHGPREGIDASIVRFGGCITCNCPITKYIHLVEGHFGVASPFMFWTRIRVEGEWVNLYV